MSSSWSISVKVVGTLPTTSSSKPSNPDPNSTTSNAPRDFNINISPDEPLSTLHSKIEQVSGLTAQQQRLIYRGRLISGPSSDDSQTAKSLLTPIRSIDGLEDGHTIHLVPRPIASPPSDGAQDEANPGAENNEGPRVITANGAGLIGALLNLGQDADSDNERGSGSSDPLETFISLPRSARPTRRRSRPNSHRRLATDPRYPDPCPLEPIRQGLMTLHTMVQSQGDISSREHVDGTVATSVDANRKWFRGQWLDVRDTVNQWLEATIVDIVTVDDLLVRAPKEEGESDDVTTQCQGNKNVTTVDPIVSANDYEGRVRLFLEPAEDENDRTLADLNSDEDLVGLVERKNNNNVQLLLVHYNGWPHRWDEWIRSDSERIRPFRTRSRHVPNTNHFCPATESTFHSAPCTHIKSADEDIDRVAMIPELYKIFRDVQKVFESAMYDGRKQRGDGARPLTSKEKRELSEAMLQVDPNIVGEVMAIVQGKYESGKDMDPADVDVSALDNETQWKLKELFELPDVYYIGDTHLPWSTNRYGKKKKRKSDVDTAQNDRNDEWEIPDSSSSLDFDIRNLEALGPLMDRLGRVLIDAAPHVAKVAESLASEESEDHVDSRQAESNSAAADSQPPSLRPSWTNTHVTPLFESELDESPNQGSSSSVNPDLVDYVHSFINIRNDGSSGRRNARRNRGDGGLGSSILSAYLASLIAGVDGTSGTRNGPRVVRVGGNDNDDAPGPGLDIHIHAIVSGPGGPMGFSDFLNNIGNGTAQTTNNDRNVNIESINQQLEEENTETFQNLYSEESPAQNTISEFMPNEDVEIEDESEAEADAYSIGGSYCGEAAMPLLESNSPVASHDETELDEEISPLDVSKLSETSNNSDQGNDQRESSLANDAITSDVPMVESEGNEVAFVCSGDFEVQNEMIQNTVSINCKDNLDSIQDEDSTDAPDVLPEENEITQGVSEDVESKLSSSIPNVDIKPIADEISIDNHNEGLDIIINDSSVSDTDRNSNSSIDLTIRNEMAKCRIPVHGARNDDNSRDDSSNDDESIHTAYECMEENEVSPGMSNHLDGEISSACPEQDIKSFIVDSKDGGDMEVCLNNLDVHENSIADGNDSKQEAARLCNEMECEPISSVASTSIGAASTLLHDQNSSEEQNDSNDREQQSYNSDAKAPKSIFARLLRRKH